MWVCVSDETRRYLEQVTLEELVERTLVGSPGRGRASESGRSSWSSTVSEVRRKRLVERDVGARRRVHERRGGRRGGTDVRARSGRGGPP